MPFPTVQLTQSNAPNVGVRPSQPPCSDLGPHSFASMEFLPLPTVILLALLLALLIFLVWFISWSDGQFRRQACDSIVRDENVTYNDIQHIAHRWHLERGRLHQQLRVLLGEALSGQSEQLSARTDVIRTFLEEHNARTPYSELPENISLQLSAITAAHPPVQMQVAQLATSLSELYAKNQKELRKQKRWTYWGAVAGVIGLVVAVATPFIMNRSVAAEPRAEPPLASSPSPSPQRQ